MRSIENGRFIVRVDKIFDLPLSFSFFLTLQNTNTCIFVATSTVLKILRIDLSTTVREFVTINISRGRSTMDEFATRPSEKFVRRQRHLPPPELFSQRPSIISGRNEESVEFYDTTVQDRGARARVPRGNISKVVSNGLISIR